MAKQTKREGFIMKTVKCPNLVEWLDWVIFLCKAGNKPYTPDYFELSRHCKSSDYRNCPYHVKTMGKATDITYPGMKDFSLMFLDKKTDKRYKENVK
jgi:hypothetical protein